MIKILHLSTSDISCDSRIIKSLQAAKDRGFLVKGIGICMEDTGQYSFYSLDDFSFENA